MKKFVALLGFLAFQALGITNVTLPYVIDTASIPKVRYVDKNDSALKWGVNNLGDTVNAATGTGVLVRKTGPTFTGTLAAANGTYSGTLGVTGVATFTAAPVLSALTASLPVFTDGSKALASNAMTGTGSVVMSASPTLTGTLAAASGTYSGTLGVTGTLTAAAAIFSGKVAGSDSITSALGFTAGSTAASNVLRYRGSADTWKTPDSVDIDGKLMVASRIRVGTSTPTYQTKRYTAIGNSFDNTAYQMENTDVTLDADGRMFNLGITDVSATEGRMDFTIPGVLTAGSIFKTGNWGFGSTTDGGEKLQVTGTSRFTGAGAFGSTLSVTGIQSNSAALTFVGAGSAADWSIWRGSGIGLGIRGGAGSSYDFALFNPAGQYLMRNPTGTQGLEFPGSGTYAFTGPVTAASTLGVTGVATFTAAPVFSSGTASQTMELTAGKALTTVAQTGTGSYVKATSPSIASPTISGNATFSGNILSNGGLAVGGGLYHTIFGENTNITLDGTLTTIQADAASGSFTLTLPAAASYAGTIYTVYKKDATSNTVTLDANASETINGALTLVLAGNSGNGRCQIMSNGTGWVVLDLYDEGTFTLTLTGVTATINGTANAVRVGKQVTLEIPALFGTSNTTACTITGLPANWRPARTGSSSAKYRASVYDNGAFLNGGELSFSSTAGTIQLGSGGSVTFTSSSTKGVDATAITYLLP